MILKDVLLTNQCQLSIDPHGVHADSFYGDINTVNGIPWPHMSLEPKWYRFRIVTVSLSRGFVWGISKPDGQPIHHEKCWVIASDGGFRKTAVPVPLVGLAVAVAERYEVVCDFRGLNEQTLYVTNSKNEAIFKGLPFFCLSHLLAKITFGSTVSDPQGEVHVTDGTGLIAEDPLHRILSEKDLELAKSRIANGDYDRRFDFGRSNGMWTINGEGWKSSRIAADDVGESTYELWFFKTGGGWHHPVHVHLTDYYILYRDGAGGLRSYEVESPKDVFLLGNSNKVWLVARFGPHKGDYMFHCHNLIHEDNDMMRAYSVVNATNSKKTATAEQFVPINDILYSNWKYANPEDELYAAKPTDLWPDLDPEITSYVRDRLDENIYRIFYPLSDDIDEWKSDKIYNPWVSNWREDKETNSCKVYSGLYSLEEAEDSS